MKRLGRPERGAISGRGLLKWRELRRVFAAMIAKGGVQIEGASVREIPDGISVRLPASAAGWVVPPWSVTIAVDEYDNVTATIQPGVVFGGSESFLVPTLDGNSMTEARSILNPLERIYLRVGFEQIIKRREYDGSTNQGLTSGLYCDYWSFAGVRMTSAEILHSAALPSAVSAQFSYQTGAVIRTGVAVALIGRVVAGVDGPELTYGPGGLMTFTGGIQSEGFAIGTFGNLVLTKLPEALTGVP